jgi:hypothetical protein
MKWSSRGSRPATLKPTARSARSGGGREVLDKYERSPYIEEQTRTYPNNPDKDGYLEALMRLRHHTIMFKLGYGDRIRAMGFTTLKNRYPEAHVSFDRELSALAVHS